MASRASLIQSRSIYVGTLNSVAPSDGNLIVTGNVGIGTTSPGAKLDVNGEIFASSNVQISAAGLAGKYYIRRPSDGSASTYFGYTSADNSDFGIYNGSGGGNIKFNSNNGIFQFNNLASGELVRITSAGNVGIGTTSPGYKLTLAAASATDSDILLAGMTGISNGFTVRRVSSSFVYSMIDGNLGVGTSSPNSRIEIAGTTGSYNSGIGFVPSGTGARAYRTYIATNGSFNFDDATAGATRINISSAGNVGIGTTAPSELLSIAGNIELTYGVNRYVYIGSATNYYYRLQSVGDDFQIQQATTPVLTIKYPTGNVGIGTTSPGEKLDVTGNVRFGAGGTAAWGNGLLTMNSGWGTGLYPTLGSYDGSVGSLIMLQNPHVPFRTDNPVTSGYTGRAGLRMAYNTTATGYWDAGLAGDFFHIYRFGTGEFLRITNSGNVGIGTTSPNVTFEANGIVRSTRSGVASQYVQIDGGNAAGPFITATGAAKVLTIQNNSTTSSDIYFDQAVASTYQFKQATVTKMVLDASGNVGIGTTSPSQKLQVEGKIYARPYLPAVLSGAGDPYYGTNLTLATDIGQTQGAVRIWSRYNTGGTAAMTFEISSTDQSYNSDPQLLTYSEKMRITSSGNVGIGTTTPAYKLDVNGTIGFSYSAANANYIEQANGAFGYGRIRPFNASGLFAFDTNYTSGGGYDFAYNGSSVIRVTSTGNVGIGTTSPTEKLAVAGNIETITPAGKIGFDVGDAYGDYPHYGLGKSSGANPVNLAGYYGLTFGTEGSERIRILGNGNVGIGTTSPLVKLDVNGAQIIQSAAGFGTDGDQAALFLSNTSNYGLSGNFSGYSRNLIKSDGGSLLTVGRWNTSLIGELSIESGSSGLIKFLSGGSERMRITSAGNVGIGTTSPSEKLHVVGTGYFTSFVGIAATTTSSWGLAVGTPVGADGAIKTTGSVQINSGALAVGSITPSATAGRIDASNDIVAYSTSDQRLKENVAPIANALDKVKALTGVEFDWKEETASVHGHHGHDVGIIAQEVQAVLPEAVRTNDSGYLSVRYEKMIALLIEANKELAYRVELLEQKLKQQ